MKYTGGERWVPEISARRVDGVDTREQRLRRVCEPRRNGGLTKWCQRLHRTFRVTASGIERGADRAIRSHERQHLVELLVVEWLAQALAKSARRVERAQH